MKSKKSSVILSWALIVICMAVIFGFSHQSADDSQSLSDRFAFLLNLPFGSFIVRKGAHFLEFAGLSALIFNALFRSFGQFRPILTLALTAVYAASDEFHQLFVDGRACRIFDWFVDCAGAACAILLLYLIITIFKSIKRRRLR